MKTKNEIKNRIKELEEIIVPLHVELNELKLELRDIEFEENKLRVREICDILFAEDPKANIVLLGARRGNFDGDRGVHVCDEYDELFEELQFKSKPKEKEYNSSNRWADTLYLDGNNDALYKLWEELVDLVSPFMPDLEEDSDTINEYWYDIVGMTKDYDLVFFVCRGDGIMENRYKNKPDIIKSYK